MFIVSRGRESDNIFGGFEAGNKRQHQIKKKMQRVGQTLWRKRGEHCKKERVLIKERRKGEVGDFYAVVVKGGIDVIEVEKVWETVMRSGRRGLLG